MIPVRLMRLGRRLLVCAALAALTRKGHDIATRETDASQAPPLHARIEGAASVEGARSVARAPFAHVADVLMLETSDAEATTTAVRVR
jgi:hypothetical protein